MAVGYSLGGAMLLKYLGEGGSFSPLRAAVTICSPIDLVRTARHMLRPRNWIYHNYILNGMKAEALVRRRAPLRRRARDRALGARVFSRVAAAARSYYGLCTPLNFMPEIRVPTLVLAACDDPWIPIEHYREFEWSDNPWLLPVMPSTRRPCRLPRRCRATGRGATWRSRSSWSAPIDFVSSAEERLRRRAR